MNDQKNIFYLIWSPEGFTPPKYCHATYEIAEKEANRLANVNQNKSFYVMKALSLHKVESRKLHDVFKDEIPF